MDDCRRRSKARTTTGSQKSRLTRGDDESDEFARLDSPVTESRSTEWTDEKHSLYLKSMEASFVDQLYNSMELLGWNSEKQVLDPKLPQYAKCDSCTSSGQFKVLRNGGWQKINFQRPETRRNVGNESLGLLASPWIRHFICARKPQVVPSSTIQETAVAQSRAMNRNGQKATSSGSSATTCSKHSSHRSQGHTYHHNVVDDNTEMSDQNFMDEDVKDEKASASSSKRMKTLAIDASGSEQVVPCGKPPMTAAT